MRTLLGPYHYHLERDASEEASVDELLGYLEKRALAMESAEPERLQPPTASGQHRQPAAYNELAAYVTSQPQQCEFIL
jgi:hypothetical protein